MDPSNSEQRARFYRNGDSWVPISLSSSSDYSIHSPSKSLSPGPSREIKPGTGVEAIDLDCRSAHALASSQSTEIGALANLGENRDARLSPCLPWAAAT